MADAVSGASKAVAMRLFGPQPSITIVTFWQGIVEIVLRGVSVVLAFVVLIAASVALNDLNENYSALDDVLDVLDNSTDWNWGQTADLSHGACGFLVFLAIVIMVVEGLIIAQRFLNFAIVDRFLTIILIVDIVISGVFAFLFFCLAIATAVYAGRFRSLESEANDVIERLPDSAADLDEDMGATSAFCFFSLITFVGLAVFMGLSLFLQWRNSRAKYAPAGSGLLSTE